MIRKIFFTVTFALAYVLGASAQITVINPSNTEVINGSSISFQWAAIATDSYQLQVSTNTLFNPLLSNDTAFNSEQLLKSGLGVGQYYWRIRNINSVDTSWSNTYSFELININAIPGLSFWLNSNSGFQTTGSNKVSSWQNAVSSNNAIQNNSAAQPSLISNAMNGNAIVSFDGVNDNLTFNPELGIREAFVVCRHNTGSQNYSPLLGDDFIQPDFHGGIGNKVFINPFTSANILNGAALVNGVSTPILNVLKPTAFTSFSISTTDSVQASTIAKDRGFTARSWNGDYAEVILFTVPLSAAQKTNIDRYLKWKFTPYPFIGKDQVVCGESIMIGVPADNEYTSISWSTGLNNVDSINITQNGTYWVTVQSFGMTFSDTVVISGIIPKPVVSINSNQIRCFGDSVSVSYTPIPGFTGFWTNGDSTASTVYKDSSQIIQVSHIDTNNCLASSDAYTLEIDSLALLSTLGPDRNTCLGTNISVTTTASGPFNYNWSTGDTTSFTSPQAIGNQDISVEMTDINNCIFRDTVNINALNLQAPAVDFSFDTVCLFSNTSFMDQSVSGGSDNIVYWKWEFGNSDSSLVQNPQYALSNHGTSVSLTVETDSSCSNSITKPVYNHKIPQASFEDFIACADDSVQLVSNSTIAAPDNIDSYLWTVENQNYNGISPLVFINNQGIQTIQLIVESDKLCADTIEKSLEIFPALLPDFMADNICIGDTTQFINTSTSFSIVDQTWHFDLLNQSSDLENPAFYYPSTGIYDVRLSVINAIGCQKEITKPVEIRERPTTLVSIDNTCEGSLSKLYDLSTSMNGFISDQTWTIEGNLLSGDSISYTFDNIGIYPIQLSIIDNFTCTADTSFTLEVYALPQVDFDFSPNYGTAPIPIQFDNESSANAVDFLWDFGDGSANSIEENPIFTYTQNGVYDIKLIGSTQEGCSDSLTRSISIIPTDLDIELSNLQLQKVTLGNGALGYKPTVLLQNVGTRAIFNADILLSINNETQIAETWVGVLDVGQAILYTLDNFAVINDESQVDYICVEALNVNDNTEENFVNNKICLVQNGSIKTSDLYPNPATNQVQVEVVVDRAGRASLAVYDLSGKTVISPQEVFLENGYNLLSLNTSSLQAGKYIVNMLYQDEIIPYSLIIHNP